MRSERELMRIIPLRIDYLWFLGYSLEDEIPNHNVLSKVRRRWGAEVFARLFRQSVQQCLEAGLVSGSKLHTDSSLVRANAALNSVVAVTLAKLEAKAGEPTKRDDGGGDVGGSGGRSISGTGWRRIRIPPWCARASGRVIPVTRVTGRWMIRPESLV